MEGLILLLQVNNSDLSNFFSMIADPVRFNILQILLKEKELSVSDIIGKVERSQTMVSYHLRCLKECGLINNKKSRKDARINYYSLHEPEFVERIVLIAENYLLKHEVCKDHPACRLKG